MIQMPCRVVVPGRSRMIVGREIRTMFESSKAMNVPIVVLVSTIYLYCIREPEAPPRPSGIYLVESRAAIRRDAANSVGEVPCDPVPRKGYRPAFFFQAEDGIRAGHVTGVQTCALPI